MAVTLNCIGACRRKKYTVLFAISTAGPELGGVSLEHVTKEPPSKRGSAQTVGRFPLVVRYELRYREC